MEQISFDSNYLKAICNMGTERHKRLRLTYFAGLRLTPQTPRSSPAHSLRKCRLEAGTENPES